MTSNIVCLRSIIKSYYVAIRFDLDPGVYTGISDEVSR